ncbi:hypothetical protein BU23DRAFT_594887 [Bimuria novae-zelandiae CBS 107.79]|uniref:Uncharacterized protein n=1 Tax=Bimuria novae-zelandiae CBS 107.79 TaxID=1447943 RepID=A0A6A5VSX7_9PLEO|nr:hypothetical protein BU23DRAFT_594887 [Bimuria novae-zelandiae CBS 107.79]
MYMYFPFFRIVFLTLLFHALHDMARAVHRCIPYSSHPLYTLRRGTLINAGIGAFLNIIVLFSLTGNYYNTERLHVFIISAVLLSVSIFFVWYDLVTHGAREAVVLSSRLNASGTDVVVPAPSRGDTWPAKALLVWDIILAVLFQWIFWGALFAIAGAIGSGYDRSETLEAYANLTNLFASILHAIAFWKELLARKHTQWQRDLNRPPCENCGHQTEPLVHHAPIDEEAGPSHQPILSNFGRVRNMMLPKWAQTSKDDQDKDVDQQEIDNGAVGDSVAEPLLATPEESTADAGGPSSSKEYGTMAQSVESVDSVPETIVKKKDKGKKRLVDVE